MRSDDRAAAARLGRPRPSPPPPSTPQGVSRRGLLRRAGLFGAAFALGSAATARARRRRAPGARRRATRASPTSSATTTSTPSTATTRSTPSPSWPARRAKYGLDWMVFTEHSNFGHADYGAALEHEEILKARAENPRQLIFQGLEWYIPAAEHCTVFAAARPARGRPAHPVRARLRRQAPRLHRGRRRPPGHRAQRGARRQGASSGWPSSAVRATSTTSWSSPTTRCASASTPRTRCAPGGTRRPRS